MFQLRILEDILMKCGECNFCKYYNSIKEFVCVKGPNGARPINEPNLPIVFESLETNCEKGNSTVKTNSKS